MKWPHLPDYGYMSRWPQDGHDFIYPNDLVNARQVIPSNRVFRRDDFDGEYYHCQYGNLTFRLRPCMWLPVRYEGIDIGDPVETIRIGMEREQWVGQIVGMEYNAYRRCIVYEIQSGPLRLPNRFPARALRLLRSKDEIRPRVSGRHVPAWQGDTYKLQKERPTDN